MNMFKKQRKSSLDMFNYWNDKTVSFAFYFVNWRLFFFSVLLLIDSFFFFEHSDLKLLPYNWAVIMAICYTNNITS